jgi:hypothetical protein
VRKHTCLTCSCTYPAVFIASGWRFELRRFLVALPASSSPASCRNRILAPHRPLREHAFRDSVRRDDDFSVVVAECAVAVEEHVLQLGCVVDELEWSFVEALFCQFLVCRAKRIGVATCMVCHRDPTDFCSLPSLPRPALFSGNRREIAAFEALRISGLWTEAACAHRHVCACTTGNPAWIKPCSTPRRPPRM